MRDFGFDIEEFREEFKKLFRAEAEKFFNNVYGLKQEEGEKQESEFMTLNETAKFFEVSRVTLSNWVKNEKIQSIKKGNQRLFNKEYIERFKQANFRYNERLPSHPDKYF